MRRAAIARLAGAFRRRLPETGAEHEHLLESRPRDLVPVEEPLVLISQVQRSGGTLLLRLLDGHPECHVAPFQLRQIDEVFKWRPTDPAQVWSTLYDPKLAERFRSGHRQVKHDVLRDKDVFPFELPPRLQRALYDACAERLSAPRTRDLIDCYFTSYFNAWLDYGNLRSGRKRWVVGFEPAVAAMKGRWENLGEVYPDGRTVSIVRDPWSWFASARRWEPRWRDREHALDHWCRAARGTLKWRKQTKGTFFILSFEDLLSRTEDTMRRLAAWLEIEYVPELLVPTFNGLPIGANTSFGDVSTEVSAKPLERAREELDADDIAFITERAGPQYERVVKVLEKERAARPGANS